MREARAEALREAMEAHCVLEFDTECEGSGAEDGSDPQAQGKLLCGAA